MDGLGSLAVWLDTAVGRCGLAWSGSALTRFALPDRDDAATWARLSAGTAGVHGDADAQLGLVALDDPVVPGWVRQAAVEVQDLLAGRRVDLGWVPVDLSALGRTARDVYELTRRIPPGQTMTYGQVAAAIGQPGAAQAVGAAMGRNPVPVVVPCHRVVGAGGALVGFSAHGGTALKRRLLEAEGAAVVAQRTLF